ncbi:DUF1385 domain-containing protein [Bryobacter aggregatus]|uniref:DUF1385 domain-containing protein n=1 Tax=Bryobacter aggregatus TaxID=360054 RepID=UPI0004E267D7|nr:DUF1385 domain-containing protein [Bryobacter aggregatus]
MNWKFFWRLNAHVQLAPILESGEETLIGGQAVMEGVMMRAPHSYCVSVRKANGEIVSETAPLAKVSDKYPIFKLPVLRGLGTLGQAMSLGMKALKFSADVQLADEEAKKQPLASSGEAKEKKPTEIPAWAMAGQLAFSLIFFIVLYKFVPLWLTEQLKTQYPVLEGRILFNLVDGLIRIAIFLAFLYGISRAKDIRRVFQYHGAEHKVVFNYESGQPVTVANAQSFVTFHPRCGTSFLIVVMLISMVLYMFLPFDTMLGKFLARIALLPVVAGLSYELIRFAAKNKGSLLTILAAPGLWLQRITTQPPDDGQAEIAIHALQGAMELEKSQGGPLVIA